MANEHTTNKKISRRELLRMTGLASGALLLAACDAATTEPPATDEPTPITEAETPLPADDPAPEPAPGEPQYGGRLRWGATRMPEGFLDPNLATGFTATFGSWIYEGLVGIDAQLADLVPRLATEWYPEDGGQTWVFKLREGVHFQHGREFVADDVVHTFERILDPDFGSPFRAIFDDISSIETPDEHTVRFRLEGPNADFPAMMPARGAAIVPYDLTDDEINTQPRGTGPFRIDNYVNADRVVLSRNEDYWQEGLPYLDEIESVTIPEATTLINSLQAGDLDAVFQVPAPLLSVVEGNPNLALKFGPAARKEHIFMRLDVEPFTDDRVRRAFKLIPDREAMAELVWGGIVPTVPADDNPVVSVNTWHLETSIWQQDLEEARRLLDEAGYGDGLEVDLWALNDQYGVMEFCLAFADWAAQAGVTINIRGVPQDRYYAENWLEVSLGTVGWSPRPTADEQLRINYTSDAPWNETRYQSAEFDAMLDEARAETDESRRAELYEAIQRKLVLEGGQIIHAHHPEAAAVRQNVHGYEYHPFQWLEPHRVWLSS